MDIPECGGSNIISGREKEQTPYWAELGEILGGILFTNRLNSVAHMVSGKGKENVN